MKEQKIEIKQSNANITDQGFECWDVYIDGILHFSTTLDRDYLEKYTIPEWLRHIEEAIEEENDPYDHIEEKERDAMLGQDEILSEKDD